MDEAAESQILSVWQVNSLVRDVLQGALPAVAVAGEISDLARPQSGHIYFTLKDEQAQIRAVMWRGAASRLDFRLADGMAVVCQGALDVYPPRGTYQLVAQRIVPQGEGALQLALRKLHQRLAAEGLFDPARKRPLPRFPAWIAVVTSPTGAAVRDFLEVVRRRFAGVRVTVVPCRVQGEGAAQELAQAVDWVNRWSPRPDVLVVTRGGGSLEDLWAFNEEVMVRAIHRAEIPVVSGVGHDIDVTLTDLVADVRALTPSEAAELVVPDERELRESLGTSQRRLMGAMQGRIDRCRQRLLGLANQRCFRRPGELILDRARRLDELQQRALRSMNQQLKRAHDQLVARTNQLDSLSPLRVLGRGYTVTLDVPSGDGRPAAVVRSARSLQPGQLIETRWLDGRALSRVEAGDATPADLNWADQDSRPKLGR